MPPKRNNKPHIRKKKPKPIISAPKKLKLYEQNFFLLDKFSAEDIENWEEKHKKLYEFYWNEYSYYAHIRSNKAESLKTSLIECCTEFQFEDWYRCVVLKYVSNPLSATGSRVSFQGGRFNIGQLSPDKFPAFSSLYLGENEGTAFREKFQVKKDNNDIFASEDYALNKKSSPVFVRVKGRLEQVLDITVSANLKPFLKQLKKMLPSDALIEQAAKLGVSIPDSIRTMKQLKEALTEFEWSSYPTALDIPSNSQIFGLIAKTAGVQAILYKSKFHTGKCLCIFTENFRDFKFIC